MAIEATPETATTKTKRQPKAPRGGNPLVDEVVAGAAPAPAPEQPAPAPATPRVEDQIVAQARQNLVPVQPEADPEENPEEREPYNPFTRMQASPPKPSLQVVREENVADRVKVNQPTPSTKRFGSLGKKLPGAERAKVHKRIEGGNLALIGEYGDSDLAHSQDIESFLHRYIRPQHGPGEYQITGIDAVGREFDMGIVTLHAPITQGAEPVAPESPLSLVRTLVERLQQPQPQPRPERDPIQMLGALHELKTKMDPPVEPKNNDLLLAVVSGFTSVASALVTVLGQPKPPDPLMQLLMAKILDDKPRSDPMPAMPAMPPPVDPTEQLKNLAAVVQSLRGPEPSVKQSDERLVDYLMKERMTPAEVLALVNQVKGERGTDDFKKSMENIGIMLNAVNQLRAHTEPGAGAGFWDAIGALVSNKELAGTVADTIRSRTRPSQPQPQQLPPQQRPMLPANDPLAAKARELAARRLALEEQEINRREQAAGIVTPAPVRSVPTAQPVQPSPEQQQAVSKAQESNGGQIPKLPPDIADYINRFVTAKDDAETVEVTIAMLYSLGESEDWKKYAEVIFSLVAQSDKARFLNYMASFFVGLRTINLIEEELAQRVMQALSANFESIVETVKDQMSEDEGEGEGDEGEEDPDDVLQLGKEDPLPGPTE
jgi:hypothetical protein